MSRFQLSFSFYNIHFIHMSINRYFNLIISGLLVCSLNILSSGYLHAQLTEPSVEECISYALKNNKNLQNAQLDMKLADHQVKELLASGYPQVNVTADASYYAKLAQFFIPQPKQDVIVVDGQPLPYLATAFNLETQQVELGDPQALAFGFPFQANAGITLNQLVFDGTFFLGLKAAKTFVEVANKQIDASAEDVAAKVSKAYFSALIARESLKILQANIDRTEKMHHDTKALFEEGFTEKIDVERLEITLNNLKLEKSRAERMAQMTLDLLKFQMGMNISEDLKLPKVSPSLNAEDPASVELNAFSPANRIELQILNTQAELESFNEQRYRMGYVPTLYAFGNYQLSSQWEKFDAAQSYDVAVVGLKLNVPVFDGFRKKHQIEQSRLRQLQIANGRAMLENSINLEVKNAKSQLSNAYNSIEAYEKNVQLAEKVYRVSEEKYREGVGSSLEVNNADTQLKQAQTNYLNGLFDYLTAKVDYQKATGAFSQYRIVD